MATASTPPTVVNVRIRALYWDKDFLPPHQHYYVAAKGTQVYLWDDAWLRKRCSDAGNLLLDIWEPEVGNWRASLAQHLVVIADEQLPVVLIRPSERRPLCFGLAQEITLLEETRGLEAGKCLAKHDFRPPEGESTPTLHLYAWGKGSEDPVLYYIGVPDDWQVQLCAFPAILEHVVGPDVGQHQDVEIWNAEIEAWRRHAISVPVLVDRARTLLLMRYPANGLGRAVGQWIAIMQRQSFSKWLLARLDEYIDAEADEAGSQSHLPTKRTRTN
ncbi:hypothetical protein C8Q76DRAFT_790421 [Earliella scabrosa]|nr:hypothetical protein C8Q76DRAFT_790421 [Earliella scabrosa]